MTNDTTTLNGALAELGELMADNLVTMGVSDADASDGLTTLANKILDVPQGGSCIQISLTSNKSILSYADSETATLTATVTENGTPKSGESVQFYKDNVAYGNPVSTDSSGIATISYPSNGIGDVSFTASVGTISSETYTVEDCIVYDSLTSASGKWTIPSGVSSTYSSDGWRATATAYKQIKLTDKLTNPCSVTFTIVDYSTPSSSYPPVIIYQYTNGDTTPNQVLLLVDSNSSMKVLGTTVSHTPIKGGVYRIEYDSTMKMYENNTLLATASNSVGLPTRFEFHVGSGSGRYVVYKDVKVKPL